MMLKKEANDLLDDIMLDRIENLSESQLRQELASYTDDIDGLKAHFLAQIAASTQASKRNVLKTARQNLEAQRKQQKGQNIDDVLSKAGTDAKGLLIQLIAQGKLSQNLTLAFRDGEEFTDNEAEKILQDLVNMGAINLDDNEN